MKGKLTSRAYEQLTAQEIRDLKVVFDAFDTDKSGLVFTIFQIIYYRRPMKHYKKALLHGIFGNNLLSVMVLYVAL